MSSELAAVLEADPIIQRFLRETGQSVEWLLSDVRLSPPMEEDLDPSA